jgi:hypothetical protein
MADDATEFWEGFEKETGEKVEARSIGEYFKGGPGDIGVWGLLILTDKSFRFKYMPSEHWIFAIFKRSDKTRPKEKPVDIVISREDMTGFKAPKRDLMSRIFAPAFPRCIVKYRGPDGERDCVFTLDPSSGLLAALERLASSGQEGATAGE